MAIFDIEIKYVKGEKNPADALSRLLPDDSSVDLSSQLGEDHPKIEQINATAIRDTCPPLPKDQITRVKAMILEGYGKNKRQNGKILISQFDLDNITDLLHHQSGHSRSICERFVLQNFTMPYLRKEIQKRLDLCYECQMAVKPTQKTLTFPAVSAPLERVFMDYKELPDKYIKGTWKCMVVIVDQFSRRVWIFNMRSFKTKMLFDNVMDWITINGYPKQIYFDKGTNFCADGFTKPLEGLGISWKNAPPSSHQTIGIVERQNREINRYFRRHHKAIESWWLHTGFIQELLNETPRKILSWKTPNEIWSNLQLPVKVHQKLNGPVSEAKNVQANQ